MGCCSCRPSEGSGLFRSYCLVCSLSWIVVSNGCWLELFGLHEDFVSAVENFGPAFDAAVFEEGFQVLAGLADVEEVGGGDGDHSVSEIVEVQHAGLSVF